MLATIGYERAELRDFIATLESCGVDLLVDIRDRAQSRRLGFSKNTLAAALSEAGIDYLHLKELGDPKEGRDAARGGDYAAFRRIYQGVMESESAKDALSRIENLALSKTVCLMCYERDQMHCHRKIVSEYLEASLSVKVWHLGVNRLPKKCSTDGRVRHLDQSTAASV